MRVPPFLVASRLALGFLIGVLVLGPAWAGNPSAEFEAIQRASLQGIDSVEAVVLAPRTVPGCELLSGPQIQSDVEARLHRAGVPTSSEPAAFLFVSVAAVEALDNLLCGLTVTVDLYQIVLLVRDIRIATVGVTWHQGALGVVAQAHSAEYLQQMLMLLMARFIAAYRDQNPTM
jgi:hypothetical protein